MSPPPLKKGWMKKLGRKGMIKNWKKRFFVLNAGMITYYENEVSDFPFGSSMKVLFIIYPSVCNQMRCKYVFL